MYQARIEMLAEFVTAGHLCGAGDMLEKIEGVGN
jgi:hypothetical protein